MTTLTYSKMTRLAAVIAAAARRTATQAKGRAIGLNMAESLAVVALLSLGGPREGAAVGLVSRLLAFPRTLDWSSTLQQDKT